MSSVGLICRSAAETIPPRTRLGRDFLSLSLSVCVCYAYKIKLQNKTKRTCSTPRYKSHNITHGTFYYTAENNLSAAVLPARTDVVAETGFSTTIFFFFVSFYLVFFFFVLPSRSSLSYTAVHFAQPPCSSSPPLTCVRTVFLFVSARNLHLKKEREQKEKPLGRRLFGYGGEKKRKKK